MEPKGPCSGNIGSRNNVLHTPGARCRHLTLVLAILLIIPGARVVTEPLESLDVARYLSRSLERGIYLVVFTIVFGILTEISYALRA